MLFTVLQSYQVAEQNSDKVICLTLNYEVHTTKAVEQPGAHFSEIPVKGAFQIPYSP